MNFTKTIAIAASLWAGISGAQAFQLKSVVTDGNYSGQCFLKRLLNDGTEATTACGSNVYLADIGKFTLISFDSEVYGKELGMTFVLYPKLATRKDGVSTYPIVSWLPSHNFKNGFTDVNPKIEGFCKFAGGDGEIHAAIIQCRFNAGFPKDSLKFAGDYLFVVRNYVLNRGLRSYSPKIQSGTCRGAVLETENDEIALETPDGRICNSHPSPEAKNSCKNDRDCELFGSTPHCGRPDDPEFTSDNCVLAGDGLYKEVRCIRSIPSNQCVVRFMKAVDLHEPASESVTFDSKHSSVPFINNSGSQTSEEKALRSFQQN